MIRYIIFIVIQSSLTFFAHISEFLHWKQGCVKTRSHIVFSISINLVICDYISQWANPVCFFLPLWFPQKFNGYSTIVIKLGKITADIGSFLRFLVCAKKF